jgi:Domain of unknown function (DUF6538)
MPLAKSPHYLVRNPHSYCFRLNVPIDLQRLVGRKELRYTLRTGYLSIARAKARIVAGSVQQIFLWLRSRRILTDLTDEKIQELIQQWLKEHIEGLESRYHENDPRPPIQDRRDFYQYLGDLDSIKSDIIEYLAIGDYKTVEGVTARILTENGIDGVEKGSVAYIKLCRGLLQAELKSIDIEKKHMSGDFSGTLEAPSLEQLPSSIPKPPAEKGDLISEVIEKFASEAQLNWRDKTRDENFSILRLFKEVVGDIPIQTITRKTVGEFKQTLKKLPPNIKKNPKFDGSVKSQAAI